MPSSRPRRSSPARLGARLLLAALTSVLSVYVASVLTESWFFDRLYYRKSLEYGYALDFPHLPYGDRLARSGVRGQDLIQLYGRSGIRINLDPKRLPPEPPQPAGTYTIIALGDSLCWGQGLEEEDRWVHRLEKRLDAIRSTRIVSLCEQGDQLAEHVMKYEASRRIWQADLYLISLVSDDLDVQPVGLPRPPDILKELEPCWTLPDLRSLPQRPRSPDEMVCPEGYACDCILRTEMKRLPKEKALYFDYGEAFQAGFNVERTLAAPFLAAGYDVITLVPEVRDAQGRFDQDYYVSHMERHPSAMANRLFADALYERIRTEPRYGFVTGEYAP